jgi:hypothetical protein
MAYIFSVINIDIFIINLVKIQIIERRRNQSEDTLWDGESRHLNQHLLFGNWNAEKSHGNRSTSSETPNLKYKNAACSFGWC